jgi:ABC-2 type transport system ATP-binding protein
MSTPRTTALRMPDPVAVPESAPEPVVVLRDVSKRYGETHALRGLDLTLPPGVVGILGPNGAGKSTLFRLLLGLEDPDQGEVHVLGLRIPESAVAVRAQVGLMPEDDCLFPELPGIEQVVHAARLSGLPRHEALPRAHQALDLCGVKELRYRLAAAYSLGQRQRLRLAMALVHGPRLLLLDEPTAGLDPEGRAQMLDLIAEIGQSGTSVLLSTHVLADVEAVAAHVALLSKGQVGFSGPIAAFRQGESGPAWKVRVVGDRDRLQNLLQGRGFKAEAAGADLLVHAAGGTADMAQFWQAALDAEVGISGFQRAEEDMAHAFVRHLHIDDPLRKVGKEAVP